MEDDDKLFDHQDWKNIVIKSTHGNKLNKKIVTTVRRKETNVKQIEEKVENDDLKHQKYDKSIAELILQKRLILNLTQKQLAQKLNIPHKIIADIESNKGIYNQQHYLKIKGFLTK